MSKIKKWWQNFLAKLAKASKEEYGNKPPECCDTGLKNPRQAQKFPPGAKK